MKFMKEMQTHEFGRSMIEMLGVLAIIGVLSVGGIAGYAKAMMKYRINKAVYDTTLIASGIRSLWAPQRNYKGVLINPGVPDQNEIMLRTGIVPKEMCKSYTSDGKCLEIANAFGGLIWVYSATRSNPGDERAFSFKQGGLSRGECIEFVGTWGSTMDVPLIYVNSPDSSRGTWLKTAESGIMDISKACEKASSSPNVRSGVTEVTLYFDIDISSDYWQNLIE